MKINSCNQSFDKSESIRSGKTRDEALLARSFNLVFEEMVDSLISNDAAEDKDIFSDLKDNKDGKQIDHIYKDRSMLDDGQIYYIGTVVKRIKLYNELIANVI